MAAIKPIYCNLDTREKLYRLGFKAHHKIPEQWEVSEFLRINYGVFIHIETIFDLSYFVSTAILKGSPEVLFNGSRKQTPSESTEEAIEEVLNKLVKQIGQ